jgi:hypothetical protein
MTMRIQPDANAPNAAVELPIHQPLPDYDLEEIEASIPRDVMSCWSQGFLTLHHEARGILKASLGLSGLNSSSSPAICGHGGVHRPGRAVFMQAPRRVSRCPSQLSSVAAPAEQPAPNYSSASCPRHAPRPHAFIFRIEAG